MRKNIIILLLLVLALVGWYWLRMLQDDDLPESTTVSADISVNNVAHHKYISPSFETEVMRASDKCSAPPDFSTKTTSPTNVSGSDISGVIPNEYILSFYSENDLDEFIRLAKSMGAKVLGRMTLGNSVSIRADAATLKKLQEEGPQSVGFDHNREINNPPLPILDPEAPKGAYNMFGNGALAWMGVSDNIDWGSGVKIAVLDSGINNHSALAKADISLLDMIGGDGHDSSTAGAHGTSVASLIVGNNEFMRGIAPASEILGIRVLDENGKGNIFTVAEGIVTAVDAGVNIINLSMGTRSDSYLLRDAVNYAAEHGVIIVAATGNDASYGISFPAGYDNVVAVPAVDAAGRHLPFSNRGDTADISGPGLGINAAGVDNTMDLFSGTSAAAPFISGAIAAIMSESPGISAAEALGILIYYSDDGGKPGPDAELGAGVIDMGRVKDRDKKGIYDIVVNSPYLETIDGGDVRLIVSLQNRGTEEIETVKLEVNIDGARYSVYFQNIPVARTVSDSFRVPSSSLEVSGNIDVSAEAVMQEHRDTHPENNYMQISLYYKLPEK